MLFMKSLNVLLLFVKKIIKSILICIWEGQKSIVWLQRIIRQGRWEKLQCNLANNNKSLWILGNGPSLATQLQEHFDIFLQHDIMCVNKISATEYFEKLQPKYYVLVDPAFYDEQYKQLRCTPEDIRAVQETFNCILKKLTWDMFLILPVEAKKNKDLIKSTICNSKIHIQYVSTAKFYGYHWLKRVLLDKQLCSFGAINVLISSLYSAIHMGYKDISIFGADHSWHRQFIVTEDNKIAVQDPHFYGKDTSYTVLDDCNISYILGCMVEAFDSYRELGDYAITKDVKIKNATPGSFIDAFEKIDYFHEL